MSYSILLIFYHLLFFYMEQAEEQQWIVVTNNKQRHRGNINNKFIHNKSNQKTYQNQHRAEYQQNFMSSSRYNENKKILENVLCQGDSECHSKHFPPYVECLGLGNFLQSKKSYYQLLFLTKLILPLINQNFSNKTKQKNQQIAVQINIYDPAFSEKQKIYISSLKATQKQEFNFKCKALNIYYMPHCQRFLYQRVLQKYRQFEKVGQKGESKLVIIGNSIKEYIQRCQLLKQEVPQIFLAKQLQQIKLADFQDSFNDTFIIYS